MKFAKVGIAIGSSMLFSALVLCVCCDAEVVFSLASVVFVVVFWLRYVLCIL